MVLDFKLPTDLAFLEGENVTRTPEATVSANSLTVRLGAVLRGRVFPGSWDLIGVRVRANATTTLTASLIDAGQTRATVRQPTTRADGWRTLWLETAALATTRPTSVPSADGLTLALSGDGGFELDHVVLAQSANVLIDAAGGPAGAFRVERRGIAWRATSGGESIATLPAAPFVEHGFSVVEANEARVLFATPAGETVCVDTWGRAIRVAADGSGGAVPPAAIEGISGAARLVRNARGDRDNDGFDESRGCFTLRASGDRFDVRLTPVTDPGDDARVVLDVDNVRPDAVPSVWVQGELATDVTRATGASDETGEAGTRLIVALPLKVERAVTANVRLK